MNEVNLAETPAPQSVEQDNQVNEVNEEPLVEEHSEQPRPSSWEFARHLGFQTLLWMQYVWSILSEVGSVAQTVGTSVLRGLQSQTFVFFEGSTHPHRLQDYTLTGPGVPPVVWYYDADKKVFYSGTVYNTTTEHHLHHFDWLAGQVKYNNLILYDVSEYIQQAKWTGQQAPPASIVMSAWALHSGIVLTLLDGITLCTINQDASESSLSLR